MDIVMRKVSELTPYDKNAKKHDATQIANVAQSIAEMGWKQPLVVDANGVVIVGHCRLLAAKKLKQKEVPCVVADDLTEEQIRKYRILDNKLAESPWELDLLAEDIADLSFDGYEIDFNLPSPLLDFMQNDPFSEKQTDPTTFAMTLEFSAQYKDDLLDYVKKNGKKPFVEAVLEVIRNA